MSKVIEVIYIRGLFFLPPYSPHLNITETLWRILKWKWLRPVDYLYTDALLFATNRAFKVIGSGPQNHFYPCSLV
ncbi:transposase [Prevotella sp.]